MGLKVVLTGATGMVGEGVLHECLNHRGIDRVLLINRRASGIVHPKVSEILLPDFNDLSAIKNELAGYDTCFFCLGVSSVGMKEPEFFEKTYTLTLNFAHVLYEKNPQMTFCYISGKGTDSSEKGRQMWARVKGKTENDLSKIGFRSFYAFRPGMLKPTPGLKNTLSYYRYFGWLYPVLDILAPDFVSTLAQLGKAMISCALNGYSKKIIEVKDIRILSKPDGA